MIHIFTDGACPKNGRPGARAAYSVVFWNLPECLAPFGIAELVPESETQTNQRAELRGMALAFKEIQTRNIKTPTTIWTDSEYTRKCVTEWGPQWKARGWKRSTNSSKPIEHLDILRGMIDYYMDSQHFIKIRYIPAHSGKQDFPYIGNDMADKLASEKANKTL